MDGRGGHRPPRRHLLGDGGDTVTASTVTASGVARFNDTGDPTNYDDDVNPSVYIAGGLAVNGHTYLNTATVGARFLNISDRRRKKKIVPKTHSIIRDLVPMEYDLTDKDGNVVHEGDVGFMAQDLKEIDDTIVHVDADGVHSVDYRAIGVHTVVELQRMLKTQQELMQTQARLQAELDQLKKIEKAVEKPAAK